MRTIITPNWAAGEGSAMTLGWIDREHDKADIRAHIFITMRWIAMEAAVQAKSLAGPFYSHIEVVRAPGFVEHGLGKAAEWPVCESPIRVEFEFSDSETVDEIQPRIRLAVAYALAREIGLNYVPTWWSPDPPCSAWDFVLPVGAK